MTHIYQYIDRNSSFWIRTVVTFKNRPHNMIYYDIIMFYFWCICIWSYNYDFSCEQSIIQRTIESKNCKIKNASKRCKISAPISVSLWTQWHKIPLKFLRRYQIKLQLKQWFNLKKTRFLMWGKIWITGTYKSALQFY